MPLSAAELLQPDCPIKPGWALFDPVWYFKCYGAQLPPGIPVTPAALLADYLARGGKAGRAPSPLFDEIYYLAVHPEIAGLVEAGRYASGFDHYCQIGHRLHSPHWLFDDALYASLHEDMTLEHLDGARFHGRYDHYLRAGQHEHRVAHLLFDGRFYIAQAIAAGDDAGIVKDLGPYKHFLYRLQGDAAELPASPYFDPPWYRQRRGKMRNSSSAIQDYLCGKAGLDPVAEFSEAFYCAVNPDVREALDSGLCSSGYMHFLQTGVFELRSPSPDVDLFFYRDQNPAVRGDLNSGAFRDAFAHLRLIGIKEKLPFRPSPDCGIGEAAAKELFIARARDNVAIFARRRLDFSTTGNCRLAVVMVVWEKFALTLQSLASLRGNFAGDMQLILVDNGSADETAEIEHYVIGAKIIRLNRNIGFLKACNLALREVAAELVLFLNNDVELEFGAVAAAISRIDSGPDIGAVGGKIIRSHGLLQEAGCIIWRDGSTSGYMRDASPLAPEANFLREVDFCSAVFLLCRSQVVAGLGGFDADFAPAYYEEADLCVRMAGAGYRILYDPAIVIRHLEYGSGDSQVARDLMARGKKTFQRKQAAFLQSRPVNTRQNLAAARSPRRGRKNILFIEDRIPLRRLGSGYVRANDIVAALAGAGHAVSIFPVNGGGFTIEDMACVPENVEMLHDLDLSQLGGFLHDRPGFYDLIWVSRTHKLARVLPICMEAEIDPARTPFILDTEAIATMREAARCSLAGNRFDFAQSLQSELALARLCRHCLAVNEAEAGLLRDAGIRSVSVLGTMRQPDPTANAFAAREGLLFVASIHRPDSPNLDALNWYVEAILPALREAMTEPPILNFAGYIAPEIDMSHLAGHPRIRIHKAAGSLRHHYEANRLFIAPTRFAAGTPYKLYEAAAFGLPSVATTLLARQLNWRNGADLLDAEVDDAKHFAAQIAHLYQSAELWERLRNNALARIARENKADAFNENVIGIVEAC
jgi:GT2 family glycosyltransferase